MSRLLAVAFLLLAPTVHAADPDPVAVAKMVRELLVAHAPTPLVESKHDWGKQVPNRRGEPKNAGHWHRTTVTIPDRSTVAVGIEDVRPGPDGVLRFTANVSADVNLRFEKQVWKNGVRLYSGETRGRCHAAVRLTCEWTTKFDRKPGALLPEAAIRLRATEARLFYKDLVIDHTLGVGGDAARLLGDAGHGLLTRVKPSLERDLLAKANAAIVKAADTKEVRLGLDRLGR